MFNITYNKGYHVTFANGWTVSVQWGYGNYCENRSMDRYNTGQPVAPSSTAEIAAWKGKTWHYFANNEKVDGWKTPEEVAAFMVEVSKFV